MEDREKRAREWAKSRKWIRKKVTRLGRMHPNKSRYRKVGSNWQPRDSRQGGDIRICLATIHRHDKFGQNVLPVPPQVKF